MVRGTFKNSFAGARHMESRPLPVTIPAGKTVRQDVSVSIP
jgi:hypothetical protein